MVKVPGPKKVHESFMEVILDIELFPESMIVACLSAGKTVREDREALFKTRVFVEASKETCPCMPSPAIESVDSYTEMSPITMYGRESYSCA